MILWMVVMEGVKVVWMVVNDCGCDGGEDGGVDGGEDGVMDSGEEDCENGGKDDVFGGAEGVW